MTDEADEEVLKLLMTKCTGGMQELKMSAASDESMNEKSATLK
jgi:hypothetical protein